MIGTTIKTNELLSSASLKYILLLFAGTAGMQLPRVCWGIDLNDEGIILTRQWNLINFHEIRGIAAFTLGSDLVGGMWLRCVQDLGLIGARLGGLLINCLNAFVVYAILIRMFIARDVFWSILTSAFVITVFGPYSLSIHYYTFPALLISCLILCLLLATERDSTLKVQQLASVSAGMLLVALSFSRLPLIIPSLLALIVCFGLIIFADSENRLRTVASYGLLGWISCLSLLIIILGVMGVLDNYSKSILFGFSENLSNDLAESKVAILIPKLLIRVFKVFCIVSVFFAIMAFTLMIRNKIGRFMSGALVILFLIILLVGKSDGPAQSFARFCEVLFGLSLVGSALTFNHKKKKAWWLLIIGVLMSFSLAIGSNVLLRGAVHGLWFALPCFLLLVRTFSDKKLLGVSLQPHYLYSSLCIGLIVVSCIGAILPSQYIWDGIDKVPEIKHKEISSSVFYDHPRLKGILDNSNRVRIVEGVIRTIEKNTRSDDYILCYNYIGLFYYLAMRRPMLHTPAPYHFQLKGVVKAQLQDAIAEGRTPELCVFLKNDYSRLKLPDSFQEDILFFRDTFVRSLGYTNIYSNEDYDIYKKPKEL